MKSMLTHWIDSLLLALLTTGLEAWNDAKPGTVQELEARLTGLMDEAKGLQAKADAEGRALTPEEASRVEACLDDCEDLQTDLERRRRMATADAALSKPQGRKTSPPAPSGGGRVDVLDAETGRGGFRTFGEFAMSVKAASRPGAAADPRLIRNAPTSFGSEGVGPDGGFAVPPDFRAEIMQTILAEDSLLARTDQMQTSSNSLTIPKDEGAPWGSGGVQAYWEGEGEQLTGTKPTLAQSAIRVPKLTSLVPVTEELLEDAPGLEGYLRKKVPEVMDYKIADAIVRGTGVGMPLGILNSPAVIEVAKESGQVADTVLAQNISNMWARCYGPSRRNAVWLINQDIEPQLDQMHYAVKNVAGTENVGGFPVYIPAGGYSASPYSTLKGRPVIPIAACSTLGDAGDIILADLGQYATVRKSVGMRIDTSIHLYFDYAITAFRFIFRMGGQPWWSKAVSPAHGSNTLSPFVTLAARA